MKIALRNNRIAICAAVLLSLFLSQLPNTSVSAATICIGPAAYPPDLPGCLDPVVLAKQEADKKAAEEKLQPMPLRLKAKRCCES
jgi:hypothetical protein